MKGEADFSRGIKREDVGCLSLIDRPSVLGHHGHFLSRYACFEAKRDSDASIGRDKHLAEDTLFVGSMLGLASSLHLYAGCRVVEGRGAKAGYTHCKRSKDCDS